MPGASAYPKILGVYSLHKMSELGSGATQVDHKNITYWYVRQLGEGRFEVQPLTVKGLPSGMRKNTSMPEFIKNYRPEPFYYNEHPVPELDGLAGAILDAGEGFTFQSLSGKDLATLQAILVESFDAPGQPTPENREAHEELMRQAAGVLRMLMARCPVARQENRERFNAFAVNLRKDGHYDESIDYYTRALKIEKNDENIYFNLARVYYDMGDYDACAKVLGQALEINPEFIEAGKFIDYLNRKELLSS
jgi:tetratricopeptide (TPR) repeat protein